MRILGVEAGFSVSLQLGLSTSTVACKPIITRSSLSRRFLSFSAPSFAKDKVKKHIKKQVKETRTTGLIAVCMNSWISIALGQRQRGKAMKSRVVSPSKFQAIVA